MPGFVWLPALVAAAMAPVLAGSGLCWTDDPGVLVLVEAVVSGAAIHMAVLLVVWMLAGQPARPETDVMALLRRVAR
jgi:hypothetical protein